MLIARVSVQTNAAGIKALVAQLAKETIEVPATFSGCERFDVAVDVTDPHKIMIIEEWTDHIAADAYLASDYFKTAGSILMPLLVAPPDSVYYEATVVGP